MDRYPYPLALSIFLVQVALGTLLFATFQEWAPAALGVGDGWGGYLLAAYGGARFLFEAPTGAISNRVERRLGLLIGYALMLPAIGLMAISRRRSRLLRACGPARVRDGVPLARDIRDERRPLRPGPPREGDRLS